MAARLTSRRVGIISSRRAKIHRPTYIGASSASSSLMVSADSIPSTTNAPSLLASTRISGTSRMGSASSILNGSNAKYNYSQQQGSYSSTFAILAATTMAAAATSLSLTNNSPTAYCESNNTATATDGLADETEDQNGSNIIVQDGMDAGSEIPLISPKLDNTSQAEEVDEDETNNSNSNDNTSDDDEDDDPSNDEPTTCSICLINRQGPCRKYWLKFEGCMKEHGAEQDRVDKKKKKEFTSEDEEEVVELDGENDTANDDEDLSGEEWGDVSQSLSAKEMEGEWDAFMVKSIQPGEDDDEDEDDEEEDDEDEATDNSNDEEEEDNKEDMSLSQRCDQYMIPWISCIQEHRNVYSLISNAFYQKDYIDPLEDTVLDSHRMCYNKDHSEIGEVDGYVIKFHGVEIDLGSWREHVEADADEGGQDSAVDVPMEEPHLVNAYAKFQLTHPTNGKPIEVAYIKDQKGRLLGFDSFTKSKEDNAASGSSTDDEMVHNSDEEKSAAAPVSNDGECTFHIVPGETTSITAYAIYRGDVVKKKEDETNEEGEGGGNVGMREDFMFTTPEIPLPGMKKRK